MEIVENTVAHYGGNEEVRGAGRAQNDDDDDDDNIILCETCAGTKPIGNDFRTFILLRYMASSRDLVRDEYTVAGSERTTGYYNIMRTYSHIRED